MWWQKHGKLTRSRFQYHLPRIRGCFAGKKARDVRSDDIQAFLDDLEKEKLAASTINKYRTILSSTFNFAIKRHKYDHNPVSVVPQRKEPPGRDRFLPPAEFRKLLDECRAEPELYAFVWLAATTGARKGTILPRKWEEVEDSSPHLYIPRTKNGRSKRLPLASEVISALKRLPSYQANEYVFPADQSNVRFKGKQAYAWDMRKPFPGCLRARRRRRPADSRSAPHGDQHPVPPRDPGSHHPQAHRAPQPRAGALRAPLPTVEAPDGGVDRQRDH